MPTINSNIPKSNVPTAVERSGNRPQVEKQDKPSSPATTTLKAAGQNDELHLSEQVEAAISTADFDQRKVEELRLAIARGSYPMDTMHVTESFMDLEKLL
jgi:flagellar biosynthesis anti-sigma factor FlgM